MRPESAANYFAALLPFAAMVGALPTITTKGNKFFTSEGEQWFIKGVAYQLLPDDPLVNTTQCQLDAALMKTLGANAIRVYHVSGTENHDGCMSAFEQAGIYLFVDLDTFDDTIVQTNPYWTSAQQGEFEQVMDSFQKYDNLAGYFIGNEIINEVGSATLAAPYIKASVADMKAYQAAKGYRTVPIGYSHADVAGLRPALQDYFVCGGNALQNIDFFGLNCYEWCGGVTYETSGYENILASTVGYPVPIFMSETGCNVPEPRTFLDQNAIFQNMSGSWSGSIVYEWIQEENHYGLITYGGSSNALDYGGVVYRSGNPVPISPDFSNLKSVWRTNVPLSISASAYTPSLTAPACPAYTAGVWEVGGNVALPTLGANVNAPRSTSGVLAAPTSSHKVTAVDISSITSLSTPRPAASTSTVLAPHSSSSSATAAAQSTPASTKVLSSGLENSAIATHTSSLSNSRQTIGTSGGVSSTTAAPVASGQTTTTTGRSASATDTVAPTATGRGGASGGREIANMGLGLGAVLACAVWWL